MGDSPESIANAFVQHYYSTLSSNPTQMGSLYQDGSNLIWEGTRFDGQKAIAEKLQTTGQMGLKFDTPKIDCTLANNPNSLLIFVTSKMTIGENPPLLFAHFFHLVSTGPGQFYIHNEIFRLIYG